MWKSKFYGAFVLNLRVVLHAIDATPARWRGDADSSPLDGASTGASSPRNDLVKNCRVHPTHWLIFHTGRDPPCPRASWCPFRRRKRVARREVRAAARFLAPGPARGALELRDVRAFLSAWRGCCLMTTKGGASPETFSAPTVSAGQVCARFPVHRRTPAAMVAVLQCADERAGAIDGPGLKPCDTHPPQLISLPGGTPGTADLSFGGWNSDSRPAGCRQRHHHLRRPYVEQSNS